MALSIALEHVVPDPLDKDRVQRSTVWDSEVEFESPSTVQVNAPSGTGKTTLVHLLYGLRRDYSGSIRFDGQDIRNMSPDAWAGIRQKRLSAVFQDLRLFEHSSALENILLKAALQNESTEFPIGEADIRQMATELGIADKLDRPVRTLSLGERQRVAIIRALCQPFDWLLLDEPFSHLDRDNVKRARELILAAVSRRGAGLLIAGLGYEYGITPDHQYEL